MTDAITNREALRLDFGHGGNSHLFKRDGWHGPDGFFSWTQGDESVLRLRAPAQGKILALSLEVGPILSDKLGITEQKFEIRLNDRTVAHSSIRKREALHFELEPLSFQTNEILNLHIFHPTPVRPCDIYADSEDARLLSLAFSSIVFHYEFTQMTATDILLSANNGISHLADEQHNIIWAEPRPKHGDYFISLTVAKSALAAACCNAGFACGNEGFLLSENYPIFLSFPLDGNRLEAAGSISLYIQDCDISPTISLKCKGAKSRLSDKQGRNLKRWDVFEFNNSMFLDFTFELEDTAYNSVTVKNIEFFIPKRNAVSFSAKDKDLFVSAVRTLLNTGAADQAKIIQELNPFYDGSDSASLEASRDIARHKFDAVWETQIMKKAALQGHRNEVEIATNLRSQGRSLVGAALLAELLSREPTNYRAHFELGVAYRSAGWLKRAMTHFSKVPSPHPHWLGVILWTEHKLAETRRSAIKILAQRRKNHRNFDVGQIAQLVEYSFSLSRIAILRRLLEKGHLDPVISKKIILRLQLFLRGSEIITDTASRLRSKNFDNIDEAIKNENWLLLESGCYSFAARRIASRLAPGLMTGEYATLSLARYFTDDLNAHAEKREAKQPQNLIGLNEAQMFISEALRDGSASNLSSLAAFRPSRSSYERRKIIQFWNDEIPPSDVKHCIESWRDLNPEYDHLLYSEKSARDFIENNYGLRFRKCFDICHHPAMKSDFLRMLALHFYGGIYFDADLVCIRSLCTTVLHDIIAVDGVIAVPAVPNFPYALNNDIVSAPKGSSFMRDLADVAAKQIEDDYAQNIISDVGQVTGPGLYTRMIAMRAIQSSERKGKNVFTEDERFIIVPYIYRNVFSRARNDLEYFRSRPHWFVAQQQRTSR